MSVAHHKTMKLRRTQRRPGRAGTFHWLSSSQIAWTRKVHPAKAEKEKKKEKEREEDQWRRRGKNWRSRRILNWSSGITSRVRVPAAVAGDVSLVWTELVLRLTCANCDVNLQHRHNQCRSSISLKHFMSVHNLLRLSDHYGDQLKGTCYSSSTPTPWSLIYFTVYCLEQRLG